MLNSWCSSPHFFQCLPRLRRYSKGSQSSALWHAAASKTRLRRSNAAGLIGRITLPGLANGAVPNTAALSILGETLKNS